MNFLLANLLCFEYNNIRVRKHLIYASVAQLVERRIRNA